MLFYTPRAQCFSLLSIFTLSQKLRRINTVVITVSETNKGSKQISKHFLVSQKQSAYKRDFWPSNIWLSILFTHWLLTLHSKWNMAHFTGINEAPPYHQLRSRRRHGANKHGQFKRVENKSSTKGRPVELSHSSYKLPCAPVPSPTPSTHPHPVQPCPFLSSFVMLIELSLQI